MDTHTPNGCMNAHTYIHTHIHTGMFVRRHRFCRWSGSFGACMYIYVYVCMYIHAK